MVVIHGENVWSQHDVKIINNNTIIKVVTNNKNNYKQVSAEKVLLTYSNLAEKHVSIYISARVAV